ncbi:MAG TPA: DUF1343 domain-containing protein, partial [Longimicrobiales bacterium]|nr:DUF1343 domain-containing protein [Longimicrobiales bacterium]
GAAVPDTADPVTGLPVVSLYGERMAPATDDLRNLDGVLFDVPDVGARFYTYAWTLTHLIDVCAEAGIPVWVLDRPNPLGGILEMAEGPALQRAHASFIGRLGIPVRHALTLGELGRLWQRERQPVSDVRVIRCDGWRRHLLWPQTGLPFVPTSPAIGSFDAALLYPGLCVFEATNLSVARGTGASFRAVGAPWLDVQPVLDRLASRFLPGILTRPGHFTPGTGPHAGVRCSAVCLEVDDPEAVRPVAAGIALLADVAATHGEFSWQPYPTVANPSGAGHLERLLGTAAVGEAVTRDPSAVSDAVIRAWVAEPGWADRCQEVLLYE